jgi:hypothetical protein
VLLVVAGAERLAQSVVGCRTWRRVLLGVAHGAECCWLSRVAPSVARCRTGGAVGFECCWLSHGWSAWRRGCSLSHLAQSVLVVARVERLAQGVLVVARGAGWCWLSHGRSSWRRVVLVVARAEQLVQSVLLVAHGAECCWVVARAEQLV